MRRPKFRDDSNININEWNEMKWNGWIIYYNHEWVLSSCVCTRTDYLYNAHFVHNMHHAKKYINLDKDYLSVTHHIYNMTVWKWCQSFYTNSSNQLIIPSPELIIFVAQHEICIKCALEDAFSFHSREPTPLTLLIRVVLMHCNPTFPPKFTWRIWR